MYELPSLFRSLAVAALIGCLSHAPAAAAPPAAVGGQAPTPPASLMGSPRPVKPVPALPTLLPPDTLKPDATFTERLGAEMLKIGKTAEVTHDKLEQGILQQTIRLDKFFGYDNLAKEPDTRYELVIRGALRWEEGGKIQPGASISAHVSLARVNERLNLFISGQNEPEPFAPRLPRDPGNPGFDRTFRAARLVNAELRYQLIRTSANYLFLGTGLELALPPQLFARSRYQYTHRFGTATRGDFAETVFAKLKDGPGETTEFSLARMLSPTLMLRWANSGTVSQEIGGLEWGTELSLAYQLSAKSAVTVAGGIYGNTSYDDDWVRNYQLYVRYRRNILRPWLFYELEPQVSWPRVADDRYPTTYAFTFRLEVQFRGNEKEEVEMWRP